MTLAETQKPTDQADQTPLPSGLEGAGNLEGIQQIMSHLKKGEWVPMVGAIMTLWKEYFGTPEEKAEIVRARKERKDARTQRETRDGLQALRSSVDATGTPSKKPDQKKVDAEAEIVPYKPGTKEPHVSPKSAFERQVREIYARQDTLFTVNNLEKNFGRDYKKYLIDIDPITNEQPISFLGRPVIGGINLMMLPFLRKVEKDLMALDLNYIPKQKEVRGFQDRNMCVGNQNGEPILDPNIPSFHKYGLAVDIDPDTNWPKDGRGTIPDEVILAMAEAGFAVGNVSDPSFYYLMNDTMHYQLRFPPDSAAGRNIIDASPVATRYWNAISPMLDRIKQVA